MYNYYSFLYTNFTTTLSTLMQIICSYLMIVLLITAIKPGSLWAQTTHFTYATSGNTNGTTRATVTNPQNAYTTTLDDDFALLEPTNLVLEGTASLQLIFPSSVTATISNPVTVYIKTSENSVNNFGISVKAYSTLNDEVSTSNLSNYLLPDGNVFITINISSTFNSVRISLTGYSFTPGVKVYSAFYGNNPANASNPYTSIATDCGLPYATTIKAIGVSLLGNTNIDNPTHAIDIDLTPSTSSTYKVGTIGLAATLIQTFYFKGNGNMGDGAKLIIGYGSAILNTTLLSQINIRAYNGNSPFGDPVNINNLITLGLGGLLPNSTKLEINFIPTPAVGTTIGFDRIDVTLNAAVAISTGPVFSIYDVRRIPEIPISQDISACENLGSVNLTALSNQDVILGNGLIYKWYEEPLGGTVNAIGKAFTPTGLTAPVTKTFYVDITKPNCTTTSPSARKKVTLNLLKPPISPPLNLSP